MKAQLVGVKYPSLSEGITGTRLTVTHPQIDKLYELKCKPTTSYATVPAFEGSVIKLYEGDTLIAKVTVGYLVSQEIRLERIVAATVIAPIAIDPPVIEPSGNELTQISTLPPEVIPSGPKTETAVERIARIKAAMAAARGK